MGEINKTYGKIQINNDVLEIIDSASQSTSLSSNTLQFSNTTYNYIKSGYNNEHILFPGYGGVLQWRFEGNGTSLGIAVHSKDNTYHYLNIHTKGINARTNTTVGDNLIKFDASDQLIVGGTDTSSYHVKAVKILAQPGVSSFTNGADIHIQAGAKYAGGTDGDLLLQATQGNVGIGTNTPAEKLDVVGSVKISQVLKLSGLTQTEINALTPVAGDIVYNTTTNKHQGFDGTIWNNLY